jgi:DNA-binding NtrC family response regulator
MSTSTKMSPTPRTILVVDDDASVLTVVSYMLHSGGYDVITTPNAEAALRVVGRDNPKIDLVLLNVLMPDLPGSALADHIFAIRPHIKVLFMSGYSDTEVVCVKIIDRGLKLLPMPFTSNVLVSAIDNMLSVPLRRSAAAGTNGGTSRSSRR